ncbi:MAG: HD-GYP domain-containing protein [Clostridiaceae bacterium]|nr:HD-GYP domain-containing protein [Clostridiaceae bacterium]
MRKILVDKVKEGMVLARTLHSYDGNILLNAGIILKNSYIAKFSDLGIREVYVEDEISRDIVLKDVVSEETRFEARINIKNAMDSIRYGNSLDVKPVRNSVCNMIDELMDVKDTMVNLQDLKSNDQYTFSHSVNVCVLSLITGISMKFDEEKLKELGIGAMLHDVGKIKIPSKILNKPGSLTTEEFNIVKKHTSYGYELLKKSKVLSTYASYIALTHHERYDGEGYPLGLRGEEIHEFARIVSVADVYDAITSDRVYKKRVNINEAVEYLIGMGDHQFDYNIVRNFIEHITIYPPGTCVLLNDGEKAIVVDVNKKYPNRPIIRILVDKEGQIPMEPVEIDLTKNNTLLISEIIDDI